MLKNKKLLTIGAVVATITAVLLALGWFFSSAFGHNPMSYGMHPGIARSWMSLGSVGMPFISMVLLAIWLTPLALSVGLVAWIIKSRATPDKIE